MRTKLVGSYDMNQTMGRVRTLVSSTADPDVTGSLTGNWPVSDGAGHVGTPAEVWAANTYPEDRLITKILYQCSQNSNQYVCLYTGASGGPFTEILGKLSGVNAWGSGNICTSKWFLPIPVRIPKGQRLSYIAGTNMASQQDYLIVEHYPISAAPLLGYDLGEFANFPTRYEFVHSQFSNGSTYGNPGISISNTFNVWPDNKFSVPKAVIGMAFGNAGFGAEIQLGTGGTESSDAAVSIGQPFMFNFGEANSANTTWASRPVVVPASTRLACRTQAGCVGVHVVDLHEVPWKKYLHWVA
jgi:hypothetical protein